MRLTTIVLSTLLLISCGGEKPAPVVEENQSFDQFKERFIDAFWEMNPGWASAVGNHRFDSIIKVPNEASRQEVIAFANAYLDSLSAFDEAELNPLNKCDLYMIQDQLRSEIWYTETFKSWAWNPSNYNLGESFALILNGRHAPLDVRMRAMAKRMEGVADYYEAAQSNISDPTLSHTRMGISRNKGTLDVFGPTMIDSVHASGLSETEKHDLLANIEIAKLAVTGYIDFLENTVLPAAEDSARDFRIGKELYSQKFDHDIQSSYSADEVYGKALEAKADLLKKMFKLTEEMWPKYFEGKEIPDSTEAIAQMIDHLSQGHVHRDSFLTEIQRQIPILTEFVREKDLLYLDPEKPLVVREEPAYLGGFAGASISAPGPYDKYADTYYNVGPLDNFTEEQAESYLREYNDYVLQILNIHEAIPGHYAQLVYANMSPSIIKSIFGNGAMIEGWAVYTERMMLEEGYGNHEPEMWLLYYKWNMRVVCNTILDYSIHVLGWDEEKGSDLLMNQAFQEESEARGKWRRATLSQVQLCSYFTGFKEIYDLRDELKAEQGEEFNLKTFHEEFLSFGSAPVKYVRELMLNKTPS